MKNAGYAANIQDLNLKNVVAACSMDKKLNLYKLHTDNARQCEWEPDLFNGLKFKFDRTKPAVAMIFASGKFNITGAGSYKEVQKLSEKMYEFLKLYEI